MTPRREFAGALLITALAVTPVVAAPGAGPAETPSVFALPHQLTGLVVAVNLGTLMLTVRTSERTLSLKADADTAPKLSTLKTGDRVKVSYKNSKGEMVATRIDPA